MSNKQQTLFEGNNATSPLNAVVMRSGSIEQKIRRGLKYICTAILDYQPKEIFFGFSGGTDSLTAVEAFKKYLPVAKICHINPGVGSKKTRQYVRNYCDKKRWELVEVRAKEDAGMDYKEIVMKHGFPGPGKHLEMYTQLKERPLRVLHRRYKQHRGGKIMMITGIRQDESDNRTGYADQIINEINGVVWVNAMYWFTKQDKHDFIENRNLQVNEVSKVTGLSFECGCGSYASKGELSLLRIVDPESADEIESLQKEVRKRFPWGWEDKPPKWWKELKNGQSEVFGNHKKYSHQFMCAGCNKKNA